MAEYEWRGHVIEIEFRAFAASLWLTGGFIVVVSGNRFYPNPHGVSFNTETEFRIEEGGRTYLGIVKSLAPMKLLPQMSYSVTVEDEEIARDRQTLRNWQLSFTIFGIFVLLFLLAAVGAITIVLLILFHLFG